MKVGEERGFALLITLLIIVLLSVLILGFFYQARVYLLQADGRADLLRAYYLARSGINLKVKTIKEDGAENAYDGLDERWARKEEVSSKEGGFSVRVVDEESKFNINTLVRGNGGIDERAMERFRRLLNNLGLDEGLAQRIADLLKGQKETSYDIDDLSQLLDQNGIQPYQLEILRGFVTVNSSGLVNVNTAPKEVLMALSDDVSEGIAEAIMEYRKSNPFMKKTDLKGVHGLTDSVLITFSDIIDVKSSFFTIESEGEKEGIRKRITALVKREGNDVTILKWREE